MPKSLEKPFLISSSTTTPSKLDYYSEEKKEYFLYTMKSNCSDLVKTNIGAQKKNGTPKKRTIILIDLAKSESTKAFHRIPSNVLPLVDLSCFLFGLVVQILD